MSAYIGRTFWFVVAALDDLTYHGSLFLNGGAQGSQFDGT